MIIKLRKGISSVSKKKKVPTINQTTLETIAERLTTGPTQTEVPDAPPRKLSFFRVRVKIDTNNIVDYYVAAPTQCAATRYSVLRPEVTDFLFAELISQATAEAKGLTFSTELDC
jgi:hypothetical protein